MAIFKDKHYFRVNLEKETDTDESLWMRCKACGELVFKRRVRENNNICPHCGEYFFLTAKERIESLIDEGSFEDISQPIMAEDIDFQSYTKKRLITDLNKTNYSCREYLRYRNNAYFYFESAE